MLLFCSMHAPSFLGICTRSALAAEERSLAPGMIVTLGGNCKRRGHVRLRPKDRGRCIGVHMSWAFGGLFCFLTSTGLLEGSGLRSGCLWTAQRAMIGRELRPGREKYWYNAWYDVDFSATRFSARRGWGCSRERRTGQTGGCEWSAVGFLAGGK